MAEGWTITELARRSGFNKNHLRLLELGQNMISMQMLFALADFFRVDAADIVREVEQQRRERKAARAAAMLARAGLAAPAGDHSPSA
jgi:transcriptional regulator with XRE-family HTH domain